MSDAITYTVPTNAAEAGRMFGDPDTHVSLGVLFQRALNNRDIDDNELKTRINTWVYKNRPELSVPERLNATGNIHKELGRSNMSWRVFHHGLDIIGIDAFKITI